MAVSLSQRLLPALPCCYWEPLGGEGWWGWARARLGTFPTGGAQTLEVGSTPRSACQVSAASSTSGTRAS